MFPEEQPCFFISRIRFDGAVPKAMAWVAGHARQFEGRCVGAAGMNYILKSYQAAFLERGLITTRVGAPEQDLSSGELQLRLVTGKLAEVRLTEKSAPARRTWATASPLDPGDIISLRALEQGLEQMRSIPGRDVSVELEPGDEPGESILLLSAGRVRPIIGSLSLNNFASDSVGRWQGAGALSALNLLGLSEIVSASYNRRIDAPGIPADSQGIGLNAAIPLGWWSMGLSASANRYGQTIIGEVRNFETRGKLQVVSAFIERVVHRDRISRTALRLSYSRRWARNYIDDVEIGLQRQDLSDVEIALVDRRSIASLKINSELAYRMGVDLFGAQDDEPGQPALLPTARYRILTLDLAASLPFPGGIVENWRVAFRGQAASTPLFGSDLISVGGPFTVRGYQSDRADLGKTGWYIRQELAARMSEHLRPYLLLDMGRVARRGGMLAGLGGGLRAGAHGFSLDAFLAVPLARDRLAGRQIAQLGLTAGWSF